MRRKAPILFTLCLLLGALFMAAAPSDKIPLTHDVYDSWKFIARQGLSPDGQWLYFIEAPQKGEGAVVVRKLADGTEYRHAIGFTGEGTDAERNAKVQFSWDSRHLVFIISPDQETVKAAKKDKKKKDKPKKALGIMHLADGHVEVVERVKSFAMPKEAAGYVAFLMEKPKPVKKDKKKDKEKPEKAEAEKPAEEKKSEAVKPAEPETKKAEAEAEKPEKSKEEKKREERLKARNKKKKEGTELIIRPLADTVGVALKSVVGYRFTKNGKHLLYIVSTKDSMAVDGLFTMTPGDTAGRALLTGKGDYKRWAMNKDETVLAFMTNKDEWEAMEPTFDLYGWHVGDAQAERWVSHKSTAGFPKGNAVSDKSAMTFSENGQQLLFGIKEIEEVDLDEDDKEPEAKFELWHWDDPYPYPQQGKMAKRVRDNTWESVYDVKKKRFTQLADEALPDLTLHRRGKVAYANNEWPYAKLGAYENWYSDAWVVNLKSGKRTLAGKKLIGGARISPEGRFLSWFDSKDWWIYSIKSGQKINVTEGLGVRFDREDHDTPTPPSSYGSGGWTEGDAHFLIYDKYDIWAVSPDGKKRYCLTEGYGRAHDLSFRMTRLDREAMAYKADAPLLLRTTNTETMASGFYRDQVTGTVEPERLLMAEKGHGYPAKAKRAEKVLFTRQAVDEFPDLWVSNLDFSDAKKVTSLGAQMDNYIWPKAELRNFKSADGMPLKGILLKPENFNPDKQYPMMVYIYETLHQGLHRYRHPSPGSSINYSYYVSNGYVVWMPDIEYHTGYPGQDAMKCVLPGIQMLVREGFVNEDAIGIQGHSWGGYQIAYMITQTDIFAAVEAGAPVSNMTSAYGGIRWDSGMVRQFQYERTQSRLGGTLWDVPMRYIENSPVFAADKVNTPIMMMHNDADGAVPWYQGIEYIMALTRLGKEAYMFNYNGEKHGLRKRVNQEDWTIRLAEFFDHHLKGADQPDWMKNGIKAWEKDN